MTLPSNVSVVMPAYNAAATISMALESIRLQEIAVQEVVVVDDGSSDATVEIVESWRDRLPLTVIRNDRNLGICASLQRGVEAAQSEWIFRIDADDRWLPLHTKNLLPFCEDDSVSIVSARARYLDPEGSFLSLTRIVSDEDVRARLLWDNPLVHSATGFRRAAYDSVGGYGPSNECQDYYLWTRLLELGRLGYSPIPSVDYLVMPNSLSRKPKKLAFRSRWGSQADAIGRFWSRHPLWAAACSIAALSRLALYRLHILN